MKNNENINRYTRLKAIKTFGYDISWDSLKDKSVTIAGIGGLGMISSEMLARCGIGRMYLFDYDVVDIVNLNRMGFMEKDIGKPKTEVISRKMKEINPDVEIISTHGDIMNFEIDEIFENAVKNCDIVLMGLDNFAARSFCNQKCLNNKKVLIDAGVSRSALSGYIHPIFPGKNACMMCTAKIRGKNEKKERGEDCNSSLPTTMAIISGLQVQEVLKYLLKMGEIADYISYNALTGQFNNYKTKRDENCPACGDLEI